MSRSKKSRKPGSGSSGPKKLEKKEVIAANAKDKRPKNKKGKAPGNRQQEAVQKTEKTGGQSLVKDKRIGSKKPIDLGGASKLAQKQPPAKKAKKKPEPIAAIRTIEVTPIENSLEQEMHAIEQDPRLLAILEKQDDEISLSESEVELFNQLMERHEEICLQLGLDDDEDLEIDEANYKSSDDEDQLWDKFDSSDLSKFE